MNYVWLESDIQLAIFSLKIPHWNVLCLQFCEAVIGNTNVEIFCETEGSDSDEHEDCGIQDLMQCHFLKLFHLCILRVCMCVCVRAREHARVSLHV